MDYLVQIRTLTIRNFAGFASNVELRFGTQVNLLLGKNGAGKTRLLKLLSSLTRGDFTDYPAHAPLALCARFVSDAGLDVDVELESAPPSPLLPALSSPQRATLEASRSSQRGFRLKVTVSSAGERLLQTEGSANGATALIGEVEYEAQPPPNPFTGAPRGTFVEGALVAAYRTPKELPKALLELLPEVVRDQGAHRFDEALGGYRAIVENDAFALAGKQHHAVEILRSSDGTFSWFPRGLPIPSSLLRAIIKAIGNESLSQLASTRPELVLGQAKPKPIPFLMRARRAMDFKSIKLLAPIQEFDQGAQEERLVLGGYGFQCQQHSGRTFREHDLSFGQKRMLSFLFHAEAARGIVIADELVNGLHHDWIGECLDAVRTKQNFLSSQNPLLIDHLDLTFDEPSEVELIACDKRSEMISGAAAERLFAPRNLRRDEKVDIERSVALGIQQISEIVRDMGLW